MKKKFKLNIEDEALSRAAGELAKRIDFGVMAGLLQDTGWVHVKVSNADNFEVEEWVKHNVKEQFSHYDDEWVFKSKQDANWFKLRWDCDSGERLF
jgi:hypothetical protein